jgi:hypothetical protein
MYYLLGTQIIIDVARGTDNPAARWLRGMDGVILNRDIKVSTMSWASIEIEFQSSLRTPGPRSSTLVVKYRTLKCVLPLSDEAVKIWVDHLQDNMDYADADGRMHRVGFEEKLILATAIAGFQDVPITLVARREAAHQQLQILGLKVEDPYQ